jgi:hypothetical protein
VVALDYLGVLARGKNGAVPYGFGHVRLLVSRG